MGISRSASYSEFWPVYLREHAESATRIFHYVGTVLASSVLIAALATQTWWMLLLYPVVGYGFAWVSHAFIERNKPATFVHPLWSLISDYRMTFLFFTGRLDRHLRDAGVIDHPHASAAE
ncbi:MAG: DUF962 domain-containing protein [Pseudomonadota bacterium]